MIKPTYFYEETARKKGFRLVGGIDEAGRGPLSGPVVASCVVLPIDLDPKNIRDSKLLSEKQREEMEAYIVKHAISLSIGVVDSKEIDELNILNAAKKAVRLAVSFCNPNPDFVIIDGNYQFDNLPIKYESIPRSDQDSVSVAAASIIAKQNRDRIMYLLHEKYPMYNWLKNKGYGTKEHLKAIERYGITDYHRKSFSPCQNKKIRKGN